MCEFADLLSPKTHLVFNNTKVIPARLRTQLATGGHVEIFLLESLSTDLCVWRCLAKPMKKLYLGREIRFSDDLCATVIEVPDTIAEQVQAITIKFSFDSLEFMEWLKQNAEMPLPPYIRRPKFEQDESQRALDQERYQTTYAQHEGSVAAPTAGLHFSEELLAELKAKGITSSHITLHVGGGTFLPVKTQDIRQHQIHEERYIVSKATILAWQHALAQSAPIIAVGTTSLRAIESIGRLCDYQIDQAEQFADKLQRTSLFIHPTEGRLIKAWLIDALFTNFHQPQSSLFMLVSALFGITEMHATYAEAVAHRYRFHSYGDASLLWLK